MSQHLHYPASACSVCPKPKGLDDYTHYASPDGLHWWQKQVDGWHIAIRAHSLDAERELPSMDRLFRLPKPEPKPVPKPKPEPPAPAENYGLLLEEMAAAPQEQLTTNAPSLGALAMGAERPEQGFPWELPAPEVRHTLDAGPILPLLGLILVLAVALFLRSRRS